MPTGKEIVDLVFIPRIGIPYPAMIIELKMNKDVESALQQIKDKYYAYQLKDYQDNLLLVGISYDKDTKKHTCQIERYKA